MLHNLEAISEREQRMFAIRNRALLYLRGMGIGALPGMELAAESLRRAGEDPRMERVFEELFALLCERELHPPALKETGRLAAHPRLNRRSMLARELPVFRCRAAVRSLCLGLLNLQIGRASCRERV